MGVIGGLLFSLVLDIGMSMIMAFKNMFIPGIIVGIVLLLFLIPMCVGLKDSSKK